MMAVAETTQLSRAQALPILSAALKEDVGSRDVTSAALVGKGQSARADLVIREEGVLAGLNLVEWTFGLVDPKIRFQPSARDGQAVFPGKAVALVEGPARGILAAERVALNFLGHLSGIATLTQAFVKQAKGTTVQIMDTRKTTPGLRSLEKYAVVMGGGVNHRISLSEHVLIKDNHLRLMMGLTNGGESISAVERSVAQARKVVPKTMVVEVEVTSLKEFRQALAASPDIILLDNMKLSDIQEAVRIRNAVGRSKKARRSLLEVSGGVTLKTVKGLAATGVDRISVGALTRCAQSLDVALEFLDL